MHSASNHTDTNGLLIEAISRAISESSIVILATLVSASREVGAKLLVDEAGERVGSLGDFELDEAVAHHAPIFMASRAEAGIFNVEEFAPRLESWRGARVLFERIEPEPRLVICGAGHVGASLARLARFTGYRTILIDDRADFVTRERFPDQNIELRAAENWTSALREAIGKGRGVSVAIVTRGHNEDEECLRAALESRPDYIGLIGSKRRTNIVLERLRETGVDEERLREVRAPVGLDIGAVSPEEVALAILAEIVAERRGGSGAPLSAWRRKQEVNGDTN
jgi:xanthine dehydrogenase accessory factor